MTVHMFRVHIGPNTSKMDFAQAETTLDDWVQSNAEWADDVDDHGLAVYPDFNESGNEVWSANTRFLLDDAKDNLLQKFGDKFKDKCEWYRIGYHQCSNDHDTQRACTWDDEIEWTAKDVTVPSYVPSFI